MARYGNWGWQKTAKRKIPAGSGIRGGTKYGQTWWGKQWLEAFNNISDSNRLPRGRTYANNGSVRSIEIAGQVVKAEVWGTSSYAIKINVGKFNDAEIKTIVSGIQTQPLVLAQLLNGELPEAILKLCQKEGIELFPSNWRSFDAHCSCPDYAKPCKHLAAIVYLLANEIDKNPFLLFTLHGFDLLKALEKSSSKQQLASETTQILSVDSLWQAMDQNYQDDFVFVPQILETLDFSVIPPCRENLLKILSPNPVFYPAKDFKDILDRALNRFARTASAEYEASSQIDWKEYYYARSEVVEFRVNQRGKVQYFTVLDGEDEELFATDKPAEWQAWVAGIPAGKLAQLPADTRALGLASRLAKVLVQQGAIVPQLVETEHQAYFIRWLPAMVNEKVAEVVTQFAELLPRYVVLVEQADGTLLLPTDGERPLVLLSIFIQEIINNTLVPGRNNLALQQQVEALFFNAEVLVFKNFADQAVPLAISQWLHRYFMGSKDLVPILAVVELPDASIGIDLAIQNKAKPRTLPTPLAKAFQSKEFAPHLMGILRDLAAITEFFPDLQTYVNQQGQAPLRYTLPAFGHLLTSTLPTLRLIGLSIILPKSMAKLLRPSLSVRLESTGKALGNSAVSVAEILKYNWQIAIGEHDLTPAEFLALLKESEGLVKFKDEYVFIDQTDANKLVARLNQAPTLSGVELLQAALTETYAGSRITLSKEVREQIEALKSVDLLPLPANLKATLRPYQQRGFAWLCKNAQLGFGSILADDMGLGKTLQVITTLLHFKESGSLHPEQPALVVLPTTLLGNWDREIKKFAPTLTTAIYHGPSRALAETASADIVLTSYGVARTDTKLLEKLPWSVLVIDEAQNIKNPGASQSKAIKKIPAQIRIALSGTPVENRLSEYWSIFDFTNPNYLGTLQHFKTTFANPIEGERNQPALQRFQKVTQPFVLRRMKTDRSIISDLPLKMEQNHYCNLAAEQASLYQSVVDKTLQKIAKADGKNRKGMVLSLIMALKQICNHPAQYLKRKSADATDSGKAAAILNLLEQALENDEKTLVFTQFHEMGELLLPMINERFGFQPDFLHGGSARGERDKMVDNFQTKSSHQILLLSLKAGGTGLNLTAASQVMHYDLWWNPAVEAQANDRAYRIGQKKRVQVHRLITEGTFEEKIDAMIQEKKALANLTVASGEGWIGDLNDQELRSIFSLKGA